MEFFRTLRKSGTSLAINIPPEIIKLMNIRKGDIVKVEVEKIKGSGKKR